ncbi:MAG: TrpR-like protein [Oscillospiraceae bacterium]|nr:TrpR-like protein [Oscillospiraceae bacterium]
MIKKPSKEASMALYEQIVKLQDVDTCLRFFQDLCSISELRAMEQRFDVAKLLYEGKVYTEIVEQTGASSATISRVNRALKYGDNGLMEAFESE